MRGMRWIVAVVFVVLVAGVSPAAAAPGDLDDGWGGDGVVITSPTDFGELAYDVAVQPDGRVVAAGYQRDATLFVRYLDDGGLDPEFGGDGTVAVDVVRRASDQIWAVAVDGEGRIVGVGSSRDGDRLLAIRLLPDGTRDEGFGGDGIVEINTPGLGTLLGVAVQPDDRVVAVGEVAGARPFGPNAPPNSRHYVARLTEDGQLDPTFSGDGQIIANPTPRIDTLTAVVVMDDGRIVAGGQLGSVGRDLTNARTQIRRWWPGGRVDTSFTSGVFQADLVAGWDDLNALHVDAADRVYYAGGGGRRMLFGRLTANGRRDTGYRGGSPTLDLPGGTEHADDMVVDGQDRVLLVGSRFIMGTPDPVLVARLDTSGQFDDEFSGNGWAAIHFAPGDDDHAYGIAADLDDDVLVAGQSHSSLAVARLLGS